MNYEEPQQFKLFGIVYTATPGVANNIFLELCRHDEYRKYLEAAATLDVLTQSAPQSFVQCAASIIDEKVKLDLKMTLIADRIILKHTTGK